MQYIINGLTIPSGHVEKYITISETVELSSGNVEASKIELEILNYNNYYYDDRCENSFFYGSNFINTDVIINDDDGKQNWRGKIIDVRFNEMNNSVTVECVNLLYNISTSLCQISEDSVTPVEAIKAILIDNCNIAEEQISSSSFVNVNNNLKNSGIYISINYLEEHNIKCVNVLNELCRIIDLDISIENNVVFFDMDENFTGQCGYTISDQYKIADSYSHRFDSTNILNNSLIYYKTAEKVVKLDSDLCSDQDSIDQWGVRFFSVPSKNLGTDPDNYKILIIGKTAAKIISSVKIYNKKNLKKICSFILSYNFDFLRKKDFLYLNFKPFVYEPVKILSLEKNKDAGEITVTAEFLNIPQILNIQSPPENIELINVIPVSNSSIRLEFSKNIESTLHGYNIYFAEYPGEWYKFLLNNFSSPLLKTSWNTDGEVCYLDIDKLNPGSSLYFAVTAVDNKLQESNITNNLRVFIPEEINTTYIKTYNTAGDLFSYTGISWSATSPEIKLLECKNSEIDYYGLYITDKIICSAWSKISAIIEKTGNVRLCCFKNNYTIFSLAENLKSEWEDVSSYSSTGEAHGRGAVWIGQAPTNLATSQIFNPYVISAYTSWTETALADDWKEVVVVGWKAALVRAAGLAFAGRPAGQYCAGIELIVISGEMHCVFSSGSVFREELESTGDNHFQKSVTTATTLVMGLYFERDAVIDGDVTFRYRHVMLESGQDFSSEYCAASASQSFLRYQISDIRDFYWDNPSYSIVFFTKIMGVGRNYYGIMITPFVFGDQISIANYFGYCHTNEEFFSVTLSEVPAYVTGSLSMNMSVSPDLVRSQWVMCSAIYQNGKLLIEFRGEGFCVSREIDVVYPASISAIQDLEFPALDLYVRDMIVAPDEAFTATKRAEMFNALGNNPDYSYIETLKGYLAEGQASDAQLTVPLAGADNYFLLKIDDDSWSGSARCIGITKD